MRWCNSSISDSLGDFCVLSADRFVKCIRKFTVDLFRTWNLLIHMALLSLLFRFATAKWTKLPLTNVSYRYISADSGLCDVRMEVFFDPHHNITISYILHCRGSVHCGRRVLFPFDLLRWLRTQQFSRWEMSHPKLPTTLYSIERKWGNDTYLKTLPLY